MSPRSPHARRLVRQLRGPGALLLALTAAFALFEVVIYVGGIRSAGTAGDIEDLAYDVVFLLAGLACLRRGRSRSDERLGWTVFGLGLLFSAGGYFYDEIHWLLTHQYSFPSPADVLWTAMYPCLYFGALRIAAVRGGHRPGLLLDGAIGALAMVALAAELVVPRLETMANGDPATVITNIVYPLADLHLFAFVLWTWVLSGRRLGPMWPSALAVLGVSLGVDAVYLVQTAAGTYVDGSLLDLGWIAVAVGYGVLPFLPRPPVHVAGRARPSLGLVVPAIGTLVCAGVLIDAAIDGAEYVSAGLATLGLLVSIVRGYRVTEVARRLQSEVSLRNEQLAEAQTLAAMGSSTFEPVSGSWKWSDELWRIHGLEPGAIELSSERILEFVHGDDRDRMRAQLGSIATGPPQRFDASFRIVRPDGELRDLDLRGHMVDGAVHASIQDVTERRVTENRLRKSEARYRTVVETAHDGIWLVDRDRRTVFVNSRMAEMLGCPPEQLLGAQPRTFTDDEGRTLLDSMWRHSADGSGTQRELKFVRGDGETLWALVSTSPIFDFNDGATMVVTDITQRKLLEAGLRRAAEVDDHTGLPNRAVFEREVAAAIADGRSFAVALIDLDHFKWVNDSFGHAAGDELLRYAADVMGEHLRANDVLARFGGDEFTVLIRDVEADGALAAVERLLQGLRDERWRGHGHLRASAGIAGARRGTSASPGELLRAADIALYEAKDAGRDRCVLYHGRKDGLAWVDEVRAAIEQEDLVLYSQTIFPLGEGQQREELLVRMRGADGDLLPPSAFIPTAEQFGLIGDLDIWVVRRAIELAFDGRAVEINISGSSLGDPRIRDAVATAAAVGLDPSLLTFEITETSAVRNIAAARAFAEALTALGCGVALDDFGTGYGSLIYLRHLPVTQIKIDQDFVRHLADQPEDERMVRAIVGLAKTLGTETVAEGVEDASIVDLLREIGVDYAQGYALQRPQPVTPAGHVASPAQ